MAQQQEKQKLLNERYLSNQNDDAEVLKTILQIHMSLYLSHTLFNNFTRSGNSPFHMGVEKYTHPVNTGLSFVRVNVGFI